MVPIYRKLTALLTVAFLTFTFALGGTALAIISLGGSDLGASPFNTPLFNQYGMMNGAQAQNIIDNIASGSIVDRTHQFRLFQQTGTGTAQALSNMNWRMASISGDRVTFYAVGTYRNLAFHTNANASSQVYSSSNLRTQMVADFNAVTTAWPTSVRTANIPTLGSSLDNANTNDQIWLPRGADIQDGGAWGLNAAARAGTGSTAWLRTATRNGVTAATGTQWRAFVRDQHFGSFSYGGYSYWDWHNVGTERLAPGTEGVWSFTQPRSVGIVINTFQVYISPYNYGQGRTVISRHESQTVPTVTHVAGMAAHVTAAGAVSATANAGSTVTTGTLGIRPALHVSLAMLQSAAGLDGPGDGDTVFSTGVDISGANIPISELFPSAISQYRSQIAVGHWVRTHNANWPGMLRHVSAITGTGDARIVHFGTTIWQPPTGGGNNPWGRPPGAMIFATTSSIEEDEIYLDDLFGAPAYRDTVRPGDLVLSTHEDTLGVMRMILGIAPGADAVVTLGVVVGGGSGFGIGLAEMVAESYTRGLSVSDFGNNEDYDAFRTALFAAENALFYLTKLTAEEVMVLAEALRDAMASAV